MLDICYDLLNERMRFKMHTQLVFARCFRFIPMDFSIECAHWHIWSIGWPLPIFHFLYSLFFLYIFRMHCILYTLYSVYVCSRFYERENHSRSAFNIFQQRMKARSTKWIAKRTTKREEKKNQNRSEQKCQKWTYRHSACTNHWFHWFIHQNLLALSFSLVWPFCWWYIYILHKIVSEKLNGFCDLCYVWFWASSNCFVLLKWIFFSPYFLSVAVHFHRFISVQGRNATNKSSCIPCSMQIEPCTMKHETNTFTCHAAFWNSIECADMSYKCITRRVIISTFNIRPNVYPMYGHRAFIEFHSIKCLCFDHGT